MEFWKRSVESLVIAMDLSFYKGKKVLVTGHTGFKGSWMIRVLKILGAHVVGYSLAPQMSPNLFDLSKTDCESVIADIRDINTLKQTFDKYKPEIVIHMAAQPIVRASYDDPVYTYDVNVMGTVNVLECVRLCDSVKSFINVTTDKVYKNNEWIWGYRETDELDGYDPYSNSKSCSELVTSSYIKSFLSKSCSVSTMRAGNVIGGGDFAVDRILPDCIRSAMRKEAIIVRNPNSTRPYQHVLEPVCAYLLVGMRQFEDSTLQGCYNVGPNDEDCVTTGKLVDLFCKKYGEGIYWENRGTRDTRHEAGFLKLDCSKIKSVFQWNPVWNISDAVEKTVEWVKCWHADSDITKIMGRQIEEYLDCEKGYCKRG